MGRLDIGGKGKAMRDTQFTKGPWLFSSNPKDQPSPLYAGIVAMIEHSPDGVKCVHAESGYVAKQQWAANGHQLAAAPDLYEALAEMLAAVELEGADGVRFFGARNSGLAALAKARGEAERTAGE